MNHYYKKSEFDPVEERKLLALNRRRVTIVRILTPLWLIAVLGLWTYVTLVMKRPITHPGSFVFPILLMLPFYPFRVHKILFGKSYYATVGKADFVMTYKAITGPITFGQARKWEQPAFSVTFYGDNGERKTVIYKESSVMNKEGYYKPGDRVLVLNGLKYPVRYPISDKERMICPVCGHELKAGLLKCGWCRANFE